MATGRFTVSLNGITVADIENEIRTDGRNELLNINFEVPNEAVNIIAPLPEELIFGPALRRRERMASLLEDGGISDRVMHFIHIPTLRSRGIRKDV